MKIKARIASRFERFKAFLIDIFLLYVPILYIFYFILGSKQAFLANQLVHCLCPVLFGLIQALFFFYKAQSPGLKAYDLYLIDLKNGKKLNFFRIILRYVLFLIGAAFLFGFIISFLRKDSLAFHDILSRSYIIRKVA